MKVFFSTQRIQSIDTVNNDGCGTYSGKTQDELEATEGPLEIIDAEEAYQRERAKHITDPREVSEERYMDMLEVLPPCKWQRPTPGCTVFHVSERIDHDIVSWFIHQGARYFELQNSDKLTGLQVLSLVSEKFRATSAKEPS